MVRGLTVAFTKKIIAMSASKRFLATGQHLTRLQEDHNNNECFTNGTGKSNKMNVHDPSGPHPG